VEAFAALALTLVMIAIPTAFAVNVLRSDARARLRRVRASLDSPRPARSLPEPERIRPARGGCGVSGCRIRSPHSHVQALAELLRRTRGPS